MATRDAETEDPARERGRPRARSRGACGHAGERREHRGMAGGPRVPCGPHIRRVPPDPEEGPRDEDPASFLKEQTGGNRDRGAAGALAARRASASEPPPPPLVERHSR